MDEYTLPGWVGKDGEIPVVADRWDGQTKLIQFDGVFVGFGKLPADIKLPGVEPKQAKRRRIARNRSARDRRRPNN
jgi:hypothetical protein